MRICLLRRWLPLLGLVVVLGIALVQQTADREPVFAQPNCNWAGTWDTLYSGSIPAVMMLTHSGNKVTGVYDHDEGKITGTVQGSTLTGTWSEAPSYEPANDAGDIEFTISIDCMTFSGRWRFGSISDWDTWTARRRGPVPTVAAAGATSTTTVTTQTPTVSPTTTATTTQTPVVTSTAQSGNASGTWLNSPRGTGSCPPASQWLLLYWSGTDRTTIASAAVVCSGVDRFWVHRDGRWAGYAPAAPDASDTWNAFAGEAHFMHGK